MRTITKLLSSFIGVLLLSFAISFLLYLPSAHSKFVYDINMHFIAYERYGIAGFWHDWGESTIRWGINCVNYAIWRLAGANDWVWYTIFIFCHALTAAMLWQVLTMLLRRTAQLQVQAIAACSTLLFLIAPYHTETIVWGATLFYITFAASLLGIIWCLLRYAARPQPRYLLLLYLLYGYEMVTFEVFIVVPAISVLLYLFLRRTGTVAFTARRLVTALVLPQIFIIIFYFVWNKVRIGQIVGHYGAAAHFHFDIWQLVGNLTKYLLKFGYLHLFLDYGLRDRLYAHLDHHTPLILLLAAYLIAGGTAAVLFLRKKTAAAVKLTCALAALFIIALAPVLNLYWPYCKDIEQERYLYIPALFFCPLLVLLSFQLWRQGAWAVVAVCFAVSLFFLHRNVGYWQDNGRIFNSLIADYRWPDARRIFILLNGDNYHGAYMMRDMPESAFAEMLYVQRHIDITHRSWDLLQYNVEHPDDSSTHEIIDSNTIKVTFGQWGNWYWYKSFGAGSYDSTLYKVTIDEWKHSFTAQFKDKQPGDVYIYQSRDKWVEIKGF